MAGYDGGLDPTRNQFNHELSYTNYSYTPEVQNQQSYHGDQMHSSNATGDYQNETLNNETRSFPVVNLDGVNSINTATGQQYLGKSERENDGVLGEGNKSEGRHDRRLEVSEIGALRAYHRALKEDRMKSMKTINEAPVENMTGVEPVAVTFVDKKSGIEYDAFGHIIPPTAVDIQPQATSEYSDDAIFPCPERPPSYGHYYPPEYNSQYPPQSIPQQNPDYGYDQPTPNAFQYDPQVPSHQYAGQAQPQPQRWTFYPSSPNLANQPSTVGPKVPDYMACSIMVFLCCCWPFGLAAICRASAAKEAERQGNYAAAIQHAGSAKTWITFGIILGILSYMIIGVSIYFRMQYYNSH